MFVVFVCSCTSGTTPKSMTVGAAGGAVTSNGVQLTIPAGAVKSDTTFTVATSTDPPPVGYVALSPVFVFGPPGTSFAVPIRVELPISGDGSGAHVFWSRLVGDGFDDLGGTASGGTISANVTHFSQGFGGTASSGSDAAMADLATGGCACATSLSCCGGACVDTSSDAKNCGTCGAACSTGQSCLAGTCRSANCTNAGQSCNANIPCCTGTCSNGVCPACGARGQPCGAAGTMPCCSGVCSTTFTCS
jgi:hypothetical protein